MNRIVVSIPTFNTPYKLLRKAVTSVLNQTVGDIRLVVVNDGGNPPRELPDDSRLIVFHLPENRGRYFADAVVTEAIRDQPDTIWVVHDADDWSEPDRFERLLPDMKDGAVVARYWRNRPGRPDFIQEPSRERLANPAQGFTHLAHWCSGAYSSERVQRAGGIHPDFRVGFDTLFIRMLALTGPVGISEHLGYHWVRRSSGSLTTHPETRFGSPHRAEAKRLLIRLDDAAWEARGKDPGRVIRADVKAETAAAVARQAERLRRMLA